MTPERLQQIRADIVIESLQGGLFDGVHENPGAQRALARVLANPIAALRAGQGTYQEQP